jgi:TolB-like protein/Flp pilus assembly protein TadD
VAYRTGFSSPAYFNHCFHQHFGHPPGEVRKTATGQHCPNKPRSPAPVANGRPAAGSRRPIGPCAPPADRADRADAGRGPGPGLCTSRHSGPDPPARSPAEAPPAIAVLPFEYLGPDKNKQYLADGVLDAITSQLAGIGQLRVIARTSVEKYRQSTADARDIGADLNVSHLLEGSFQLEGDRVRLIAQLINSGDGTHVWSRTYDREWKEIFQIQTEVARAIAEAIELSLTPGQQAELAARPTADPTAYDLYLRGKDYFGRGYWPKDHFLAIQMFEKSIEIDPDFALSWATLCEVYRSIYWLFIDRSEENKKKFTACLDRAMALAPNLKEVRIAQSLYWHTYEYDYPRALQILEQLRAEYPNADNICEWIGFVYGRMGDYKKSEEYLNAAIALNPMEWDHWNTLAIYYHVMRQYEKGKKCCQWMIDFNPAVAYAGPLMLSNLYIVTGHLREGEEILNVCAKDLPPVLSKKLISRLEVLKGNIAGAIEIIEPMPEEDLLERAGWEYKSRNMRLGMLYHLASDQLRSAAHYADEREVLLRQIETNPDDYRLHAALGIACAGLGLREEALRAGKKALELENLSIDAFRGYYPENDYTVILMLLGDYDAALDQLEYVASRHGYVVAENLNQDPFWNPAREHPKFLAIVNNPAYQANLEVD